MAIENELDIKHELGENPKLIEYIFSGFMSQDIRGEFPAVTIRPINEEGSNNGDNQSTLLNRFSAFANEIYKWWYNSQDNDNSHKMSIPEFYKAFEMLIGGGELAEISFQPGDSTLSSFFERFIQPVQDWISYRLDKNYNNWLAENHPHLVKPSSSIQSTEPMDF